MKSIITTIAVLMLASCGSLSSLNSNTFIKANDSFLLGNNVHDTFTVRMKNVSNHDVTVFMKPISHGRHSTVIVKPQESLKTTVEINTALVIENNSEDVANIELKVTGDLNLQMGYKK
jgi:hypothetical protein